MCNQFGFEFSSVNRTYSVVQNRNDTFRGNAVSILYDPGKFPALLEKPSTKTLYKRNGGVPQEGNLTEHLEIFERHLDELIPDRNFSGIGIIDFESWRPIYRQNFGSLQPYKDLSVKIERERHPYWSGNHLEREVGKQINCFSSVNDTTTSPVATTKRSHTKRTHYWGSFLKRFQPFEQ
uniref:Hyaluronidase n=1 Tax=Anopheles arabiensis TaxID=7173 RepID=A0A182HNI5_ANOAR